MNIVRKVRAVERLFKTLEKDVRNLQNQTGLYCVENCIHCCTTNHIMASSVEFYPLAYFLYKNDLADSLLEQIEQNGDINICPVLNRFSHDGSRLGCSFYEQRGLICRLFPYYYYTNKYGERSVSACSIMKKEQAKQVTLANELLQKAPIGPKASNYYQQLYLIDFVEAQKLYPIAEAIKRAIEIVSSDFHYRLDKAQ